MNSGIVHYINTFEGAGPSFSVDVAANEVRIDKNTLPQNLWDASLLPNFTYGDNILIEAIRVQLPYSFGNGDNASSGSQILIKLGYKDVTSGSGPISEIGVDGIIIVPTFNCDVTLNTLFYLPSNVTDDFVIQLLDLDGWISMLNVPAQLDTLVMTPQVFLKVRHTLPMKV